MLKLSALFVLLTFSSYAGVVRVTSYPVVHPMKTMQKASHWAKKIVW